MKSIISSRRIVIVGLASVMGLALVIGVAGASSVGRETLQVCLDRASIRVDTGDGCKSKEESVEVYTKAGVDAAILAANPAGGDADTLDGIDSTAFVQTDDDIDATTLDGMDSTAFAAAVHTHDDRYYTKEGADAAFLPLTGKAADADKLDGFDADAFTRTTYVTQNVEAFVVPAGECATDTISPLVPLALGTPLIHTFSEELPRAVIIRGIKVGSSGDILVDYCNFRPEEVTIPATVSIEYVALQQGNIN